MKSHLFSFALVYLARGDIPKNMLLRLISDSLLPMLSSGNFVVLGLIIQSLVYFEFYFCMQYIYICDILF